MYFFCCICKAPYSPVDGRRSTDAVKKRYGLSKLNFNVYPSLRFYYCYLDSWKILVFFFCLFCFLLRFFVCFLHQYFLLLQFFLFHNQNCQVYFHFRFRFPNLWHIQFFSSFFAVLWPIRVAVVIFFHCSCCCCCCKM